MKRGSEKKGYKYISKEMEMAIRRNLPDAMQFALGCGVGRTTLHAWLDRTNRAKVGTVLLQTLAGMFGVSKDNIYEKENQK